MVALTVNQCVTSERVVDALRLSTLPFRSQIRFIYLLFRANPQTLSIKIIYRYGPDRSLRVAKADALGLVRMFAARG
jgi:hypothetical protein